MRSLMALLMFMTTANWCFAAEDLLDPTTPPAVTTAAPMRMAPADAEAVKRAGVLVREIYAGRYAAKSDRGKRTLGRMMLRHVAWHRADPALAEVLLRESLRLACEADDHETVLAAIDELDAIFTGISIVEERRKILQQIARKPFVAALQKLFDTPDDARSCGVAGRWLGPVAGRWQEALPLLQRATADPEFQKSADSEAAASTPMQVFQAAEAWMDASKRAKGEERIGIFKHVLDLAQRALPGLDGITKTKAGQLIAKVEPQIPLDLGQVDWSTLTGEQWERIALPVIPLIAKTDRTDTGVLLKEGEAVRVVVNPDDRWSFSLAGESTPTTTDWKGVSRTYSYTVNDDNGIRTVTVVLGLQRIRYGAVLAFTDPNRRMRAGIIRGPGKLWLGPATERRGETGTSGTMRVKIVPVDE